MLGTTELDNQSHSLSQIWEDVDPGALIRSRPLVVQILRRKGSWSGTRTLQQGFGPVFVSGVGEFLPVLRENARERVKSVAKPVRHPVEESEHNSCKQGVGKQLQPDTRIDRRARIRTRRHIACLRLALDADRLCLDLQLVSRSPVRELLGHSSRGRSD